MLSNRDQEPADSAKATASDDPVWSPAAYFRANLAGALASTGFGIAIIIAASGYDFTVGQLPGPGMYPMLIGIAMTVLGTIWVMGTWIGRYPPDAETGSPPERNALVRSLLAVLIIVGFVFALRPLGYPISSAVLVSVLVLLGRGTVRKALLSGPLFAIASYLLVTTALGVPLPLGILEPLGFLR
ncbi:tripartite tricarboxylate transporter TctB family protein [Arthrobacter pigmenti]